MQYVVVIDYSDASVRFFKVELPSDDTDMEEYLTEYYGYKSSTCYYMSSDKPINVEIKGEVNYGV